MSDNGFREWAKSKFSWEYLETDDHHLESAYIAGMNAVQNKFNFVGTVEDVIDEEIMEDHMMNPSDKVYLVSDEG